MKNIVLILLLLSFAACSMAAVAARQAQSSMSEYGDSLSNILLTETAFLHGEVVSVGKGKALLTGLRSFTLEGDISNLISGEEITLEGYHIKDRFYIIKRVTN